ncbi:Rpp14/Pop5 family-domain-containing protein, partial [Lanmaoa asiatica]
NRWLLVEFISVSNDKSAVSTPHTPSSFDAKHVYTALRQSIISNFGNTGWGAVGGSMTGKTVKYFSPTTHLCIVRVARDQHTLAWGAVTLLTQINGARIIPHVVHVSGTIKHVQLAAIRHNRQVVARFRAMTKTPEQYQDSYEIFLTQNTREIEALQE